MIDIIIASSLNLHEPIFILIIILLLLKSIFDYGRGITEAKTKEEKALIQTSVFKAILLVGTFLFSIKKLHRDHYIYSWSVYFILLLGLIIQTYLKLKKQKNE